MALIEVEGLRHSCRVGGGLVWALDGVSLSIRQGEFVAVVGPSGSGKSTFMHILGCLDRSTDGKYRLDGRSVKELPHEALAAIRNRKIGFVFQSFNLLARASALDSRTGQEIMAIFRRLNADGLTIVLVTHEAEIAANAGRVVTFGDGRVTSDSAAMQPTPHSGALPYASLISHAR